MDGVFAALRDPLDRALCMTDFNPIPGSKTGELAAKFDVVIGRTPDERDFAR
jgi:protocatechuate 3,4-dioxygenase beta subunit